MLLLGSEQRQIIAATGICLLRSRPQYTSKLILKPIKDSPSSLGSVQYTYNLAISPPHREELDQHSAQIFKKFMMVYTYTVNNRNCFENSNCAKASLLPADHNNATLIVQRAATERRREKLLLCTAAFGLILLSSLVTVGVTLHIINANAYECRCDQKFRAEEKKPGGVCGDGFNCTSNDYEGQHDPLPENGTSVTTATTTTLATTKSDAVENVASTNTATTTIITTTTKDHVGNEASTTAATVTTTTNDNGCRCDQKCRAEEKKPGGVCGDGFNCICNDYEGQHDPWNVTGCGCGNWCRGQGKGWTRGSCGYGHICFCS